MERCEKIPPETYETRRATDKMAERLFLPNVDHDGKPLGDAEYAVPSPPERDFSKPQLTQADLEEYAKSYQDPIDTNGLTKGGLHEFIEYNRSYESSLYNSKHLHQKQVSYAQSEGYHSYVSSTDSTLTPFLDRLRRDSEAAASRPQSSDTWEAAEGGRDSVVTTSSGSASSSETLKWHGSMSDVSVASSASTHPSAGSSSRQLIAHSARVQTPQRHHSESVLYMGGNEGRQDGWKDREIRNNNANKLKLFPVNTYTVQEAERQHDGGGGGGGNNTSKNRLSLSLQSALSVADRISELEKQQKYSYLDPNKKHKVPDPTLKAIQKKALLSFYERHHQNGPGKSHHWRSEPQLAQQLSVAQSLPKVKVTVPSRRASSASDYAASTNVLKRSNFPSPETKSGAKHQHSNSCGSLSTELVGPVIVGPSISVDDWVPETPPERPPKNPNLRSTYPGLFQRVPSPDLPPPSPPTVFDDEVFHNDDPLPPPPPECESDWQREFNDRLKENSTSGHQIPQPQVQKTSQDQLHQAVGIPERVPRYSLIKTRPGDHIIQQISSRPYGSPQPVPKTDQHLGFPNQRGYAERSSTRYPTTQKLVLNGNLAVSQKVNHVADQRRPEPLRSTHRDDFKRTQNGADTHRAQRASIAVSTAKESPPPLQPRHARTNQSMRAKMAYEHRTRTSPPVEGGTREQRSASLSQSKASYLASRRDRDRIVTDSETGSYKRTMSPNGHALVAETVLPEPQKVKSRETIWPLARSCSKSSESGNVVPRRSSVNVKPKEDDTKKPSLALPDVLPVNVKMLPRSHHQYNRPTQLSLSPLGADVGKNTSPASTSPRSSPFAPLRTTSFIVQSSPVAIKSNPTKQTAQASPPRASPHIKPTLSPPVNARPQYTSSALLQQSEPKSESPPPEYPKVIEGLQMIQRTEVVLRVNTSTSDASSQTEKEELPPTPLPARKKSQEEIECERLSEDFVNHLPTSDRLKDLLVPGPDHKKPTDYVQGLFRLDVTLKPRPANSPFRSRNNTPSSSPPPVNTSKVSVSKLSLPKSVPAVEAISPLSGSSVYYTTSEPKAKFLTRYSQDMSQCHIVKDTKDLSQKKEELVSRLDKKLEVLRSEALIVSDECRINDDLGTNVENYITRVARPHEVSKFRLHVEEVGKITSLLLGLSGRLARAENALMGMSDDHPERRILESKRDKLQDQLEEAKKLKECIDKRSVSVSNILYKYLTSEEYADYDHFINMKAKLIMDSKEINDKIKLGEEQLGALKDTLIVTD
ncbi:protein Shroom isoform X2 [Cylas formicarius]|nr:protein Shroom isoform X2 [Cylas formicarius]XP_060519670.1 protein Shroom isoform X2 [Cylas formicarius]